MVSAIRMTLIALAAACWAVVRRLVRGPLVEGWGWRVEVWRAVLKAVVAAGMRSSHPERWSAFAIGAPLPRRLRSRMLVEEGTLGGVSGEWLRHRVPPPRPPTLLYFHGGGYVVGHPSTERPFIARIADAARADCFSVDYRLAPAHRFPAAVDDAVAAYRGLIDAGVSPSRIVVAGDSAGGGLAAALLVRIRDGGGPMPAGALLWSPWVDLANTATTIVTNAATDYLPMIQGHVHIDYLGAADPRHPHASPLYADLAGLPPMLVLAGGAEMILADATRLAERAAAAGVDVRLHVEPGMYHVWAAILPRHPASVAAFALAGAWVSSVTGVTRREPANAVGGPA